MARRFGITYFGGIGDCLRLLVLFHGPLLQALNRGRTPIRWNDGGSASHRLISDYMINRMPGYYAAEAGEPITELLHLPRWHRLFRWARAPIHFQLTPEEEAAMPKMPGGKPSVAICPHHHGLACKKLPAASINEILALLRARLDAEFYVFDEHAEPSTVDAPCIAGLNLTQAMVQMGRFDAAITVDSWHKYILGMFGKPQTALMVDFRQNESYTYESSPQGIYQDFFRWRLRPEEIIGFEKDFSAFTWRTAAEVDPALLAGHLLGQLKRRPRFRPWLRGG